MKDQLSTRERKTIAATRLKRLAAVNTGRSAELRAVLMLMLKGYRILKRQYRVPQGEIDIIARRGRVVAFVEVKARSTMDEAANAVTPHQRRRISNAARLWLADYPAYANFDMRFDVILIAPRHLPRHLIAAFDATR